MKKKNIAGGRGECRHCGEWLNNVSYHESNTCPFMKREKSTVSQTKGRMYVSVIKECLSPKETYALIGKEFTRWVVIEAPVNWPIVGEINIRFGLDAFTAGFLAGSKSIELKKLHPKRPSVTKLKHTK